MGRGALPLLALAAALGSHNASAQTTIGASYEMYTFADPEAVGVESLTLISSPFSVRVPLLGRTASLSFEGAYALGELSAADGQTYELQGLTDSRISLDFAVAGPLRASAIATLPTGVQSLSADEAQVAALVSSYLLPLRVSSWGSGGGVGGGASLTQAFGGSGVSVSASYLVTREYDAYEDAAAYRPGNQLRLQALGYADLSSSSRLTVRASYSNRAEDQLSGAGIYRSGDQLQAVGAMTFAVGARGSAMTYMGWMHRGEGERAEAFGGEPAPAEDLLLMGAGWRLSTGAMVVTPSADIRFYRNDAGLAQGYVGGAGIGLEIPAGRVTFIPAARGRYGHVDVRTGSSSGFTGADVSLSVRVGGRR